jgi:hypothetical protein
MLYIRSILSTLVTRHALLIIRGIFLLILSLFAAPMASAQRFERSANTSVPSTKAPDPWAASRPFVQIARVQPIAWPQVTSIPQQAWTAAGRGFYACFLSVVGSDDFIASSINRSIWITARAPTKAIVELMRSTYRDTVTIEPGSFTRVVLPQGFGLGRDDYEVPVRRALHIYSNEILTVYGFSHNTLSSDGFLIYPKQTLGTDYIVMSERNAINDNDPLITPNPRSEFAVVATEDNTTVTMKLTATSYSGLLHADSTYAIHLNYGEVYQVMARDTGVHFMFDSADPLLSEYYRPSNGGPDCDLTGSLISSDKPVAVFSGHERATSPSALEFDLQHGISRDHLIEQMVPVERWGERFAVMPADQDAQGRRRPGGDMVRIVAAYDSTTVAVNGVPSATIGRGQYYEFMSGSGCFIQCNEPVMVAKFMQTAGNDVTRDTMGDPDLTVVRPIDSWSKTYTIPGWQDPNTFMEAYLQVACDTSAMSSTLINGVPIPQYGAMKWKTIPGSPYAYCTLRASIGGQRIESPLPCYAEVYAFGNEDSYRYAGGGDYTYVDSLFAVDLDFHTVPLGRTSGTLSSPLHSSFAPVATDTVVVYNYEWVAGDTSNFTLLGNITQPLAVAPLRNLNVPFQFHPDVERAYSATLRVWSSAVNDVFIHLRGEGVVPQIKVVPDTIDFKRVRLYHRRDSLFTVSNVGSADLELTDLDFNTSIKDTAFRADTLKGVGGRFMLSPNSSIQEGVHFKPTTEGFSRVSIPIYSTDPVDGITNVPTVILEGTGVEPLVYSKNYDFGKYRVNSSSPVRTVPIVNRGSDTTAIDSVTIVGGDLADFIVSLDTLPPGPNTTPVALHYPGEGKDTSAAFSVQFSPQSIGQKRLIVRIHTVDSTVIMDTLWGEGVEPLVIVHPQVIDFGTIVVQANLTPPPPMAMNFVVYDSGTMSAHLDSLVSSDDTDFLVRLNTSNDTLNEDLAEHDSLQGTATFFITGEGDFFDTVFVRNDTRYGLYPYPVNQYVPMIILKASVRTGPVDVSNITFDTVTSCVPDTAYLTIHNPYPVEVHIDSMAFQPDSTGFARGQNFLFPINIPPDGQFNLPVQFVFPADSVDGSQLDTIVFYQRHGGGQAAMLVEAVASVYRKERQLILNAVLPAFESSAGDIAPLRVPITIAGPRDSLPELDSYTLTLQFANDLFVPVGIDTARSLSVPFGAGYSIKTQWDQTTRTYTITVSNAAVSDHTKLANNLLLAILMRAFVTTDTSVAVTPTFTFLHHPCAYNIQPFTLHIPFAEDCGTKTLRGYMFGAMPVVNVIGVRPDPLTSHSGVTVTYEARKVAQIIAVVSDANGRELGRANMSVGIGTGEFTLPDTMLPSSGTAFITIEVSDAMGEAQPRITLKTSVER